MYINKTNEYKSWEKIRIYSGFGLFKIIYVVLTKKFG
jgi:hypothetical protein